MFKPGAIACFLAICFPVTAADTDGLHPLDLRCEHLQNPLGTEVKQPRLSWVLQAGADARNRSQSAYQILVATDFRKLEVDQADLWDSRKVQSPDSILVRYEGKPLLSGEDCFWKVRVWDEHGNPSDWSEGARWRMGLLERTDWKAKWIGLEGLSTQDVHRLSGAHWIWFEDARRSVTAATGTRFFRLRFELTGASPVRKATLLFTADDRCEAFVNNQRVGVATNWRLVSAADVTGLLRSGQNFLAAVATNVKTKGAKQNPAGFIASLQIELANGDRILLNTGPEWKTSDRAMAGWKKERFNEAGWFAAQDLGPEGMEPWGKPEVLEDRRLPARVLRREFFVEKKVRQATAYVCGLGLFELYLNGRKIGDQVLTPALTDYSKRALYITFDVGGDLKAGTNAVGVVLGNGRFFAPRSRVPTETVSYGYPKLLFQMDIQYEDGSSNQVVSDAAWRVTAEGPIRANNEYDGEEYDARKEEADWSRPGFDDSRWGAARFVSAPGGVVAAQQVRPIRVTQTLEPISLKEPLPGVYVYDFGQNLAGWCRLRVSGPRATAISLRYTEALRTNGLIDLENVRSARVTDTFVLSGVGQEIYEPRFTYHGFRYVEMTGYPGTPALAALEARVVHDDLEPAGGFVCSNPLLNRLYQNIVWGLRGNYRSIPADCPQRDERQGWLGDRGATARGEAYVFDTAAFYNKWLQDIADSQKISGSLPDISPAYWPVYSDNVTWPSTAIILPGLLWEQYGDLEPIQKQYASMKCWIQYMSGFITNGIISRDSYGDWCAPPEKPELIQPRDPKRKTSKSLLATACFYHDLRLMQSYALRLNLYNDAQRFRALADGMSNAFNLKFLNPKGGKYDNGSQTSCILPLAFGLAPESQRSRLMALLERQIMIQGQPHLGTGLVGSRWLMQTLSDNGRPDLAYALATQTTYPSWGYMVEKGATTFWELWNGDTADRSMNSGNHVMLMGDLLTWFFEYLAGIAPDPAAPGFKHIVMRPEPAAGLGFVSAFHRSPYGVIKSAWTNQLSGFRWNITVPVNTTATVYLPANSFSKIKESGRALSQAPELTPLRSENGRVVFRVGSGEYHFQVDEF